MRSFIILTSIVIITSATFSFVLQDRPRVDAKAYDKIGWNLARGLGYVEEESLATIPAQDDAIIRVGPGYEFFLAFWYRIFGHDIRIIWILHALLRGASALILYFLGMKLFQNHLISMLAAGLFGFSPDLIIVNSFLLTETLFLFLLIVAVFFSILLYEKTTRLYSFFTGMLWAFAILTRPVALLPFVLILGILLFKKKWDIAVIFIIMPLVLIGSWSVMMTLRYENFIFTTTAGGYDLWIGNNPHATGGFEKTPEIQSFRNTHHSVDINKMGIRKYSEFFIEQPLVFIELQLRKLSIYFNVFRPGGFWVGLMGYPKTLLIIFFTSVIWNLIYFVFGISGILQQFFKKKDNLSKIVAGVALLQPLSVIPIIVETRYRYPFFPFLALFAASFLYNLRRSSRRTYYFLILVIVLLIICSSYDFWYNWSSIIERACLFLKRICEKL